MFQKHTYDLNGHKNSNNYTIIKLYSMFRTEPGRKPFAHQGALLFNERPRELKEVHSLLLIKLLDSFKRLKKSLVIYEGNTKQVSTMTVTLYLIQKG